MRHLLFHLQISIVCAFYKLRPINVSKITSGRRIESSFLDAGDIRVIHLIVILPRFPLFKVTAFDVSIYEAALSRVHYELPILLKTSNIDLILRGIHLSCCTHLKSFRPTRWLTHYALNADVASNQIVTSGFDVPLSHIVAVDDVIHLHAVTNILWFGLFDNLLLQNSMIVESLLMYITL